MTNNTPRGLRVEDLKPHSLSAGQGQSVPVTFRLSEDINAALEEMTIRLKPRFSGKGDLIRTAVAQFLEELAEEIGDNLTLTVIQRERVLSDLAFHAENRKFLADTLRSFEVGLWQMIEEGEHRKAHDMMVEFIEAGGLHGTDFNKLFWKSSRILEALSIIERHVSRVSSKLKRSSQTEEITQIHLAS